MEPTYQTVASSLALNQRPRRQIKHKYIQSVNQSTKSPNNDGTFDENTIDSAYDVCEQLSPTKSLVPVLHRLSDEQCNYYHTSTPSGSEDDIHDAEVEMTNSGAAVTTTITNDATINSFNERKNDKLKKAASIPVRRSGRTSLQPTVLQFDEDLITEIDSDNSDGQVDGPTNSEPAQRSNLSTIDDSDLDNDEVTIIEAEDPLLMDDLHEEGGFVAEEIVIEETIETVETVETPEIIETIANHSFETEIDEVESQQPITKPKITNTDDTDTIYLSDSLSCFDSDSDNEPSTFHKSNQINNFSEIKQFEIETPSESTKNHNVSDHSNESVDDVIMVSDLIEIEGDDESFENRFLGKSNSENDKTVHELNWEAAQNADSAVDFLEQQGKRFTRSRKGYTVQKKKQNELSSGIQKLKPEKLLENSEITAVDETSSGDDDEDDRLKFSFKGKSIRTYQRPKSQKFQKHLTLDAEMNAIPSIHDISVIKDGHVGENAVKVEQNNEFTIESPQNSENERNNSEIASSVRGRGRPRKHTANQPKTQETNTSLIPANSIGVVESVRNSIPVEIDQRSSFGQVYVDDDKTVQTDEISEVSRNSRKNVNSINDDGQPVDLASEKGVKGLLTIKKEPLTETEQQHSEVEINETAMNAEGKLVKFIEVEYNGVSIDDNFFQLLFFILASVFF